MLKRYEPQDQINEGDGLGCECRINSDGLILKNDGSILTHDGFIPNNHGFVLEHRGFILKHDGVLLKHDGCLNETDELYSKNAKMTLPGPGGRLQCAVKEGLYHGMTCDLRLSNKFTCADLSLATISKFLPFFRRDLFCHDEHHPRCCDRTLAQPGEPRCSAAPRGAVQRGRALPGAAVGLVRSNGLSSLYIHAGD